MKYLKLFEEFIITKPKSKEEREISDKTIDDVLKDDFLEDEENIESDLVSQDKGVYQIKNWKVY